MQYKVAVDVGGTFTDLIGYDETSGDIITSKAPTTPRNLVEGVTGAISKAGLRPSDMFFFSHGTTIGTNALVQRQYAKTGLVCTKGFRDILEIRTGTKQDIWDIYADTAPPYVRRRDRLEVEERVDYDGRILKNLNEEEAREVARIFNEKCMEAVAVCFLNSFANGANEKRMKDILQEEMPDAFVCTSHEVSPEIFEFPRMSTVVINACLGPVVGKYLASLAKTLRDQGYGGDVLVMQSGGGVMTADAAGYFAARIANSSPAAGVAAATYIGKQIEQNDLISLEMGGTTCGVSLITEGKPSFAPEWYVEWGYPITFPAIDMVEIGAGGGTVAWIDSGGSLRSGPISMGADPGPACYMKGGVEPTTTDANLILGRLNERNFLGGDIKIYPELANNAIKTKIADPLGLDVAEAADSIIRITNENMLGAIRLVSVQRGHDPREFVIVAYGGAGPLHCCSLAKDLGVTTTVVPKFPGLTSALGCLVVDIRHDFSKTVRMTARDIDVDKMEAGFRELEESALKRLHMEKVLPDRMRVERSIDMRYVGQWRSLTVPCPNMLNEKAVFSLLEKFHTTHEITYKFSNREFNVEFRLLRVAGIGIVDKMKSKKHEVSGQAEVALKERRDVFFSEAGDFIECPTYDRERLPAGALVEGPAIIEQMDSTTLLPPKSKAQVDQYLNLVINYH